MQLQPDTIYKAIITSIAPNGSHGYVKVIPTLKQLNQAYLKERKTLTYSFFYQKAAKLTKDQLVNVKLAKAGVTERVQIVRQTYWGIKVPYNGIAPKPMRKKRQNPPNIPQSTLLPAGNFFYSSKAFIQIASTAALKLPDYSLVRFKIACRTNGFLIAHELTEETLTKPLEKNLMLDFLNAIKGDNEVTIPHIKHYARFFKQEGAIQRTMAEKMLQNGIQNIRTRFVPNLAKELILAYELNFPTLLGFEDYATLTNNRLQVVRWWLEDKIPYSILTNSVITQLLQEPEILRGLKSVQLQKLFEQIQGEPLYDQLLKKLLQQFPKTVGHQLEVWIQLVKLSHQPAIFASDLCQHMSFGELLEHWLANTLPFSPPPMQLRQHWLELSPTQKCQILDKVGIEKYAPLATGTETQETVYTKYVEALLAQIGQTLHYCIFDLEVSPQEGTITQLAYQTPKKQWSQARPSEQQLQELRQILQGAELVIGHNIRQFDLPQLFEEDQIAQLPIWDTLEIEALLSPTADSLALATTHEAIEDVVHCLQVFIQQWIALGAKEASLEPILWLPLLPPKMAELFAQYTRWEVRFAPTVLTNARRALFHQKSHALGHALRQRLPKSVQLVVCPAQWWHYWAFYPAIHFADEAPETQAYQWVLNQQLVEDCLAEAPLLKAALTNYLLMAQQRQQPPYARRLSPYIQQQIHPLVTLDQLCMPLQQLPNDGLTVCSVKYFAQHCQALLEQYPPEQICFFATDHWPYQAHYEVITHTRQSLQQCIGQNDLWTRFANGVSASALEPVLAAQLAQEQPVFGQQYWLLRSGPDEYRLYENLAKVANQASAIMPSIKIGNHLLPEQNQPLHHPTYVQWSASESGDFVLLNPDTFYRDRYWEQKFKLIAHLLTQMGNRPVHFVLLVTKASEIPALKAIFTALKIYVPTNQAPLRRQMELVGRRSQGGIVVTIDQLDEVLSYPTSQPFTFLLENLLPYDLMHQLGVPQKATSIDQEDEAEDELLEESTDENSEESKASDEIQATLAHYSSPQQALANLKNHFDWMYTRMLWHHPQNQLIVLDPRASQNIFQQYPAQKLWLSSSQVAPRPYEQDLLVKMCRTRFPAPQDFAIDGPIEDHLRNMEAVFLKGKGENGAVASFKPNQKAYLQYIFPAQEDVLVTLPTGEGKSILFQAPALYRSSFTRKLSVVVTPLKALMEDHVQSLWKLGFWNSVEYINYDKGLEVKDIYRKIAGGELSLVFVTPERFRSNGFLQALQHRINQDQQLEYVVFDEAHCISQWGNEFRPDYFYCTHQVKALKQQTPLLLLSATITRQVAKHLKETLYN